MIHARLTTHAPPCRPWRSYMENLWDLVNLERLNVSGNQLRRLPAEVASLEKLSVLRVSRFVQSIAYWPLPVLSTLRVADPAS